MTGPAGGRRRRYAHQARRRRQPILAVTAGVLLAAVFVPVRVASTVRQLRPRGSTTPRGRDRRNISPTNVGAPVDDRAAGRTPLDCTPLDCTRSTAPATTAPKTTTGPAPPAGPAEPGVLIRVVPAVRDVQIMIGRTVYTTAADGIVDVPNARGTVHVTYIGYSVIPALQQVAFGPGPTV